MSERERRVTDHPAARSAGLGVVGGVVAGGVAAATGAAVAPIAIGGAIGLGGLHYVLQRRKRDDVETPAQGEIDTAGAQAEPEPSAA